MDHSAHSGHNMNEMDHSSMGGMGGHSMVMGAFHWSAIGDAIWLESWVPQSEPAYIGACIGLFLFAIASRGFLALENYFVAWRAKKLQDQIHPKSSNDINSSKSLTSDYQKESNYPKEFGLPEVPKFSWITDLTRSFMTAFSSFVSYLLMMAVMTGNGGYFLVIIVGVFVGEVAFGRFRSLGGGGSDGHDH
ncbi:unnamed protein product [Cunninghamella blakesleeana]